MGSPDLVMVQNLKVHFPVDGGFFGKGKKQVKAADGISFNIKRGEIVALVGESGCGKTTVGKTMVGLNKPTSGTIKYCFGNFEAEISEKNNTDIRKNVQYIFQDPYSSLNPRMRIKTVIERPMVCFRLHRKNRDERIQELMLTVGLQKEQLNRFPHEFSGGQKQRISIARALAAEPQFIIADEPTAALDVSIQGQILNLLLELRDKFALTILLITHDLGIVRQIADRVLVMYLGKIMETGTTNEIFTGPQHPYTRSLIGAMPRGPAGRNTERVRLKGSVPSPVDIPAGCRLHQRCPFALPKCAADEPATATMSDTRRVCCHLVTHK